LTCKFACEQLLVLIRVKIANRNYKLWTFNCLWCSCTVH